MKASLRSKLELRLGVQVKHVGAAASGDINETCVIELLDGRSLFVKTHARPQPGMYAHEASGLHWLSQARALRVPRVVDVAEADATGPAYLALELIRSAARRPGFDDELGRGLAQLHASGAPCFGLAHDNYLAVLPQLNTPCDSWASFYATRRLLPHAQRALAQGRLPPDMHAQLTTLCARMSELVGAEEPPARLHGDLWSGNLIADDAGAPTLIDPAVYGGHREVDLAMMRLFGGFSARVFAAYDEAFPLAPGHEARVPLYQLYPLLVHVNLFGASYLPPLQRALATLR